jgi:hypothetical protein
VSVLYSNNALGSNQLDQLILNASLGITLTIGLEVAQVTNVADLVGRSAVFLAVGVDCPLRQQPQSSLL